MGNKLSDIGKKKCFIFNIDLALRKSVGGTLIEIIDVCKVAEQNDFLNSLKALPFQKIVQYYYSMIPPIFNIKIHNRSAPLSDYR